MPRPSKVSKAEVIQLIELVRANPSLYDPICRDYKDADLWTRIAEMMGRSDMNGAAWKKEWRYRRDNYVKKKRLFHATNNGQHDLKRKKWELLNLMSFLDDGFGETSSTENHVMAVDPEEHLTRSYDSTDDSADCIERPVVFSQNTEVINRPTEDRNVQVIRRPASPRTLSASSSRSPPVQSQCSRCNYEGLLKTEADMALTELIKDHREARQRVRTPEQSFFDFCAARMETLPKEIKSCLQVQITQLFHNAENPCAPPLPIMPLQVPQQQQKQQQSQEDEQEQERKELLHHSRQKCI